MALKRITNNKVTSVKSQKVASLPLKSKVYPYYKDLYEEKEYLNISEVICRSMSLGESYKVEKHISNKLAVAFCFKTDGTWYTCGFIELGELSTSAKINNSSTILVLADLLDEVVTCSKGYTLFMNTNEYHDCKAIAAAAAISKYWTKVKTYINPGTKNMLTLWVTNN